MTEVWSLVSGEDTMLAVAGLDDEGLVILERRESKFSAILLTSDARGAPFLRSLEYSTLTTPGSLGLIR